MFLLDWPGGSWEATVKIVVTLLLIYVAIMWLALVFWVFRDIRQRSRDPIVQTVSVLLVLVFFLPGHWIYLILRPRYTLAELYERSLEEEALLQELEDQKSCPNCKRRVHDDFLVCPSCATQLKEPCRNCAKPLSYSWIRCPYCGVEKPARERALPRSVQQPAIQQQAMPQQRVANAGRGGQQTLPAATQAPRRPAPPPLQGWEVNPAPRPTPQPPRPMPGGNSVSGNAPAPARDGLPSPAQPFAPARAPRPAVEDGPVIGSE